MKPEFDRQFDSLLREHARRAGPASREGAASEGRLSEREMTAAAHLDADELSAFAENALPASARARHTAHLADCGDCRRLVSQIALASGVADEIERREPSVAVGLTSGAAASPAWRGRLASLLRPGAWRYAMPLAALLVVSAAVLVLMNGRRRGELGSVALRRENAQPAPSRGAETHHAAEQKQQADSNAAESQPAAANAAAAAADREAGTLDPARPGNQDKPAAPAPGGSGAGGSQSAPAELTKSAVTAAPAPPSAYTVAPVSVATPTPLPPAPAPTQITLRDLAATAPQPTPAPVKAEDARAAEGKEKDRYDERNAAEARKQRGHGPMRNESQQQANVRNRQAEESRAAPPKSDGNSARAGGASLAVGRVARREPEKRGEEKKKSGDDREEEAARGGETRSVGGRRFRRQGGAWVDTAYRPSQATVRVSRGSEQYRSLVGDEPELGRIANALGGEVVVVWKGRAYRIKP